MNETRIIMGKWNVNTWICPEDNNLTINVQYEDKVKDIIGARTFELKRKENGKIAIMDWSALDDGLTELKAELKLDNT
jgi:hypothetical protein